MPSFLPRKILGFSYHPLPSEPSAEVLAERLAAANVAAKAAKRIDSFERFFHQEAEHQKAQVKVVLGAIGLVLSVAPSVPVVVDSCQNDSFGQCSLRLTAITGGLIAMGVTAWSLIDLWNNPVKLSEHVARLNSEMARSMHAKNGEVAIDNLFDVYRAMHHEQRATLRTHLHEHARRPRNAAAQARADAHGLEAAEAAEAGTIGAQVAATAGAQGSIAPAEPTTLARPAQV